MSISRTASALAFVALLGALGAARADPLRAACPVDDGIPDFVRQRVELVTAGAGHPGSALLAVELERDQHCHGALGSEP